MAQQYGLPPKSTLAEPPPPRGREHYRKMREPFADELKDPATRRLLRGIISAENPGAGSAVVESLMNRTAMVNEQRAAKGQPPLTLKAMIQGDPSIGGGVSFYGPVRSGAINQHLSRVDANPNYAAQLDSSINSALNGADTIKGHTDQGSRGDPNYDTGGVGVNINGERFNDWGYGGSREWREKNQALAGDYGAAGYGGIGSDAAGSARAADARAADASANVISTTSPGPDTDPSPKQKENAGEIAGDALSQLGTSFANGPIAKNAAQASAPMNVVAPSQPPPTGVAAMVNQQAANVQRQQLAAMLQRLNTGRLY